MLNEVVIRMINGKQSWPLDPSHQNIDLPIPTLKSVQDTYTHMHLHTHAFTHMHSHTHTHTHNLRAYTHIHVQTHTLSCACTQEYTHVHTHTDNESYKRCYVQTYFWKKSNVNERHNSDHHTQYAHQGQRVLLLHAFFYDRLDNICPFCIWWYWTWKHKKIHAV